MINLLFIFQICSSQDVGFVSISQPIRAVAVLEPNPSNITGTIFFIRTDYFGNIRVEGRI